MRKEALMRREVLMGKIDYIQVGDYLLPDLRLNDDVLMDSCYKPLGRYAEMRKDYLREHRTIFYNTLLLAERLFPQLRDVDETAKERRARGVPEDIILRELVYE